MTVGPRRLKNVADVRVSNVDKKSVAGQMSVGLCNYTDVYHRGSIDREVAFMEATATPEQIRTFALQEGDSLITKDSETADDIGVGAFVAESLPRVLCGYHLALIRPNPAEVYPNFLYWWLCSDQARGHLSSGATGVTRFGLRSDVIAATPMSAPELDTQRRIAAFLDTETARLDALITKKKRMVELLDYRLSAATDGEVYELDVRFGAGQLRHACREITVGIVVTPAKWYADAGVPALRGVNVRPAEVILHDVVHLTPEGHASHPKSALSPGDVVVVRTGQAGAAAVIPATLDGANCIDLLIVRAGPGLRPHYLELVLNSKYARDRVEHDSVGAIQGHFNAGALKSLRLPIPPVAVQDEVVARLATVNKRLAGMSQRLGRQLELLSERRQALIAAAVTGKLLIPA